MAAILALYGLDLVLRPLCWCCRLTGRFRRRLCPRPVDGPQPTECSELDWRGPGTQEEVDNDYYRDNVRGRNAQRVSNHVVVIIDGKTARLERSDARQKPVNRNGLRYGYGAVVSCNRQALRQLLEEGPKDTQTVHLCRRHPCGEAEACRAHAVSYSSVDAEVSLNLYNQAWSSPLLSCCSGSLRALWGLQRVLTRGLCGCLCRRGICARCGCKRRRPSATTALGGRVLHPDSESELEEGRRCQADCIAWREDLRVVTLSAGAC